MTPPPINIRKLMEDGIDWLIGSGIRENNPEVDTFGGFYQSYNVRSGKYDFVYSEITGYAISALTNLYRWTGLEDYLTYALNAADYLLSIQYSGPNEALRGAFNYGNQFTNKTAQMNEFYSFDNAICLAGLVDAYQITARRDYLAAAKNTASWLIHEAQYPDGSFRCVYDNGRGTFKDTYQQQAWYHDHACLHGKNCIGLLKCYQATDDKTYLNAALNCANWLLKLQNPDGSFRDSTRHRYIFTHAHCYATEGLLYAYLVSKSDGYKNAILNAGKWLSTVQLPMGAFREYYQKSADPFEIIKNLKLQSNNYFDFLFNLVFNRKRSDVIAQAIRIWVLCDLLSGSRAYADRARQALYCLASMQSRNTADHRSDKGFYYSQKMFRERLPTSYLLPAWSSMFTIQACHLLLTSQESNLDKNIMELF